MSRTAAARWLWLFFSLFLLRVAGQALVGVGLAPFLPPWHAWYSGLLPYPWLLASQLLILLVLGRICIDVTRDRGYFAEPHIRLGTPVLIFGWLYLSAMELRYWLFRTHEIPVLFHNVLAAFLIVYGFYLKRRQAARLYH